MSHANQAGGIPADKTPNTQQRVELTRKDLPLHCPTPDTTVWNSHPRVFLDILDAADHRISCPYCGTEYHLKDA